MKRKLFINIQLAAVLLLSGGFSNAQIISQFDWNANPITTALVGPNGISAGAKATSSPGGVGGTNGLNPGAPSPATDIDLNIPNTGGVFDQPNIDISIDYRRNESTAQMIKRGVFSFNQAGSVANFQVKYRIANGGTVTTITSSAFAIPSDATFRNYRFSYDNCAGIASMYINSAVVWTCSPTTPGWDLYWVGDGNMIIGVQMDGANNNVPNLDNFIMQTYTCSLIVLPIELISFTGNNEGEKNYLEWKTASEKNSHYFRIERSEDGENWKIVGAVYAAGNSKERRNYYLYDASPVKNLNYYRLTQFDFDGKSQTFNTIVIDNSKESARKLIKITDVLGREVNDDYIGPCVFYYSDGTVVKKITN